MTTKEKKYSERIKSKLFIKIKLNQLGISTKYMGYFYLVEILDLIMNNDGLIRSFSKSVYPIIAQTYNKTTCTIERDIRNLIEKTDESVFCTLICSNSIQDKRPTCLKFISMVRDYILEGCL